MVHYCGEMVNIMHDVQWRHLGLLAGWRGARVVVVVAPSPSHWATVLLRSLGESTGLLGSVVVVVVC